MFGLFRGDLRSRKAFGPKAHCRLSLLLWLKWADFIVTEQARLKASAASVSSISEDFECVTEHCTSALSCLCLVQLLKTCSLIQASDYAVSNALRFGMGVVESLKHFSPKSDCSIHQMFS